MEITQVVYNTIAAISFIAAGAWFFIAQKFSQRIEFDIEATFIKLKNRSGLLGEINFIFKNKGFMEHKIYDLAVSVRGLDNNNNGLACNVKTGKIIFLKRIYGTACIMPPNQGYYFIRPGVKQNITHIIQVPENIKAISVLGGFTYKRRKVEQNKKNESKNKGALQKPYQKHNFPHTALKIVEIPN